MLYYFLFSFILSILLTFLVRRIAIMLNIVDIPDGERKPNYRPIPLLGGVAIFLSFWIAIAYLAYRPIFGFEILENKFIGIFLGSAILMVVGFFDDKKQLSPKIRLLLTAAASLITVIGGVGLAKVTNPLGGFVELSLTLGNVLVFFWLLGMMLTTKILDGLDGLSTGIAAIGAVMIYFLASSAKFYQPNVALLAAIFAGACLGFLMFNFYPAKIFLGEGGSLFVGYILGVLAVISGGKLATALLVMAVPILDLARVVFLRVRRGQPIFQGDRKHLHFQLVDLGFGHRQTVLLLYLISALFGLTTLFLQSTEKLLALLFLVVAMMAVGWRLGSKS